MPTQIREIIKEAIDELNEQLNDNAKVSYNDETRFIGSHACIDSMGFVTLITIIEGLIAEKTGKTVQLVNEKAFSQKHSPFYSIQTLSDYINELLNEKNK